MQLVAEIVATLGYISAWLPYPLALVIVLALAVWWWYQILRWSSTVAWPLALAQLSIAMILVLLVTPRLGADPRLIVIDEFVAVPFMYIFSKSTLHISWQRNAMLIGALAIVDAVKPFGLGALEQLPGAVGVIADDAGAALAVGLCALFFMNVRHYMKHRQS